LKINATTVKITSDRIKHTLKRIENDLSVADMELLYYPYYFLEVSIATKIKKITGKMACTVEMVSGEGAIANSPPDIATISTPKDTIIDHKISAERARQIGLAYLNKVLAHKFKLLSIPEIKIEKEARFYRPYWLTTCISNENEFQLIIDAFSGNYHPL